jgi:predicted small metal-binding protein
MQRPAPSRQGSSAMKDFHCRDAGMDCDFVARGQSNDEILKQAGKHAEDDHHLKVTPDLTKKVEGLIHDENSEQHRQSATRH